MRAEARPSTAPHAPASQAGASEDSLGCQAQQLGRDQTLSANGVKIYRKTSVSAELHQVETAASGRGVLVGISLGDGHSRRILHANHASTHQFGRGSIYIRDFSERYRADIQSAFDFVLIELSHAAVERAIDEGGARACGLARVAGEKDEVLANLAWALTPALENPGDASMLFVDQVSIAMGSYLVSNYAGASTAPSKARRLLSRAHEARAKEMLRSRMDGSLSIAEIADACSLSRSYFIHAFRETTGLTPHQWLTAQRMERARTLLMDFERPLAEIAAECGFSDQSHFTRVFSQCTGTPPGTWRRTMRVGR
ncbi:MAG: AraC family transcriptional regulator [Pseudomonadota bacterium]